MPRSRLASNPLSFHKPTGQHYVARGGQHAQAIVLNGPERQEPSGTAVKLCKRRLDASLQKRREDATTPSLRIESQGLLARI